MGEMECLILFSMFPSGLPVYFYVFAFGVRMMGVWELDVEEDILT